MSWGLNLQVVRRKLEAAGWTCEPGEHCFLFRKRGIPFAIETGRIHNLARGPRVQCLYLRRVEDTEHSRCGSLRFTINRALYEVEWRTRYIPLCAWVFPEGSTVHRLLEEALDSDEAAFHAMLDAIQEETEGDLDTALYLRRARAEGLFDRQPS
jgi:hypothetical protein